MSSDGAFVAVHNGFRVTCADCEAVEEGAIDFGQVEAFALRHYRTTIEPTVKSYCTGNDPISDGVS